MQELLLHPNPKSKKPNGSIQLEDTYISLTNKLNLLHFNPSLSFSLPHRSISIVCRIPPCAVFLFLAFFWRFLIDITDDTMNFEWIQMIL